MCRSNCLQSLIWKVVAIRFFHRKQCLIVTSFDIVPSASLHLNNFFCFYLYLSIKQVILLLNTNNLYKPQTFFSFLFFFNQLHIVINLLTCLTWWLSHSPEIYHIKANSVSNILSFPERPLYCPYAVENAFVLDILNG